MLRSSLIVWLLLICYISRTDSYSWDITHSLNGDVMPPISACPPEKSSDLKPESIHIIVSLTEGLVTRYSNYTETVRYYSAMHGYHFRLVDPTSMLLKFGGEFKQVFEPMTSAQAILNLKSLISLYYMHETFQTFGCNAKWLLVLDSDIMVANFARRLESIISFADEMLGGKESNTMKKATPGPESNSCQIISQLGPCTTNGGVLFFKITPEGKQVLDDWISTTLLQLRAKINWQADQGRLQKTYLDYLHKDMRIDMPLDCAMPMGKANDAMINPQNMGVNGFRNNCFARNLFVAGLLPQLRRTGRYCMLPPMNDISTFNLRDFEKEEAIRNDEYTARIIHYDGNGHVFTTGAAGVSCYLHNPLFLHNKDAHLSDPLYESFQKLQHLMQEHNITFPLKTTDVPFGTRILGFNTQRAVTGRVANSHHSRQREKLHNNHTTTGKVGKFSAESVASFWGRVEPLGACSEQVLLKLQAFGADRSRVGSYWLELTKDAKFAQTDSYATYAAPANAAQKAAAQKAPAAHTVNNRSSGTHPATSNNKAKSLQAINKLKALH